MPEKKPTKIKAELNDGTIVELEKDCGCMDEIHIGPHWLHMSDLSKELNRRILDRGGQFANVAHARAEIARLDERLRSMEYRNIKRIIREYEDDADAEV